MLKFWAMAFTATAVGLSPAWAGNGTDLKTKAACVVAAIEKEYVHVSVVKFDAPETERQAMGDAMDKNRALKVEALRKCITADEAYMLGEVSDILDILPQHGCSIQQSEVLKPRHSFEWGDADLLEGAALAYTGDTAFSGEFFKGEKAYEATLPPHMPYTPSEDSRRLCAEAIKQFGPHGDSMPGLLLP